MTIATQTAQFAVEIPTLTAWGKIFSVLLLAALGVAYLVWRRPVMQARAILETSPLGTRDRSTTLVDWGLYVKALIALDGLALIAVAALKLSGRTVGGIDVLGVLASGAIVAFVVHLLILGRGTDSTDHDRNR